MASKMLARYCKSLPALQAKAVLAPVGARCSSGHVPEVYHDVPKEIRGTREVVGWGMNGMSTYFDRIDYPFPAIRWKEEDSTIKALREKEKGDWRKLTIEEKKTLYRFNFRQTLAEINAPTGEYKSVIGWTLFGVAVSLWVSIAVRKLFLPPLPESMSLENRQAQLLRILDSNMYAVTGISRDWDQEKRRWKEQ